MCLISQDDISGRQQWTFTPASGGGYSIQVLVGRSECSPGNTYLGTVACSTNGTTAPVEMVGAEA